MATGMSSAQGLDVSGVGYTREDLPAVGSGQMLDLDAWFGGFDGRAVDLEIGSGKGTFLVQQAVLEPGVCFLGVEHAMAFWRHAADRVRRHGLHNVRLLHADADTLVKHQLPAGLLRTCHIYFPDPWPKARHHKRRLLQAPFLRALHRVLGPDGTVRLVTDHQEYFAWMQEHASVVEGEGLFERLPYEPPASAGEGEWVGTNFERKYKKEGRTIQGMILKKQEDA
ncbi:MAG: tRNA (guanosine(46)-N7)-methyltransferase TrmB [Planctomycetota bacterium]